MSCCALWSSTKQRAHAIIDRFVNVTGVGCFQGGAGKNELQELETLKERPFNHLYWSPMGNICLLAAMGDDVGPHNGRLEVKDIRTAC